MIDRCGPDCPARCDDLACPYRTVGGESRRPMTGNGLSPDEVDLLLAATEDLLTSLRGAVAEAATVAASLTDLQNVSSNGGEAPQ